MQNLEISHYHKNVLSKTELIKELERWADIAQYTFEKTDWNQCSLMHSFGDKLASHIRLAVDMMKNEKI